MGIGRRLLLADDSITIQKVVNLTFADEGLEVTTVSNGDLAVEKIEELAPDIVLADVHMPGLNGYEVCEFVKRNERFRHIPVLLLVGSFEPFNEAEARRVGADDYLTKPFQSIRQLVGKVGSLLSGKSAAPPEEDDETPTKDVELPLYPAQKEEAASAPATPAAEAVFEPGFDAEPTGAQRADFADPSLDDAMIEATPAGDYNLNRTIGSVQRPTVPLSASDVAETGLNLNQPAAINMQDTLPLHRPEKESESVASPEPAMTTSPATSADRFGQARAADDALLDLGEIDAPSAATAEADDFVLDLWDEAPAPQASASSAAIAEPPATAYEGEVSEAPAAAEFVDAEVVEAEPLVEAQPAEESAASVSAPAPQVEASSAPANPSGQITLDQLAPEVIDAIARRAVEMLSEKVIEQIAWEVVPDLAERLIKRRLEEQQKQ
ncbi:MAG: response regulator [Acidobacteria bacterium]|nr:response regulator [Acidobacteriota bacterium]